MPVGGNEQPSHWMGPVEQWDLWRGAFQPTVRYVEVERRKTLPEADERHAAGRHIVAVACVECHGSDLKGHGWDGDAPDLRVVLAYDPTTFARLLRTGIGADGNEHGLMSEVARTRFSRLSEDQVSAIFGYLRERAVQPR
jgi:mono/diheme cytochrome c family protein